MNEFLIYALFDPAQPNLPRYVGYTGRSLNERFIEHRNDAKNRPTYRHHVWFNEVLIAGRTPTISLLERCATQEQAEAREKHWIAFFRPLECLFNIASGGRGAPGVPKSEANRQATIARNKRGWSEETREKQIRIRKGIPPAPETTAKIQATSGWKLAQMKLREANEARKKPVVCLETGERFPSAAEAALALGCHKVRFHESMRKGWRCQGRYWQHETK